jgi:hypothetical protein
VLLDQQFRTVGVGADLGDDRAWPEPDDGVVRLLEEHGIVDLQAQPAGNIQCCSQTGSGTGESARPGYDGRVL